MGTKPPIARQLPGGSDLWSDPDPFSGPPLDPSSMQAMEESLPNEHSTAAGRGAAAAKVSWLHAGDLMAAAESAALGPATRVGHQHAWDPRYGSLVAQPVKKDQATNMVTQHGSMTVTH